MSLDVLILEDSSQAIFGGGQRVTLEATRCIESNFSFVLLDSFSQSWHRKISKENGSVISLNLESYFNYKVVFNFLLFFCSTWRIFWLQPARLYVTTRKHLVTAVLAKCIRPKMKVIYHYHLIPPNSLSWHLYDIVVALISTYIVFASEYTLFTYKKNRATLSQRIQNKLLMCPPPPPKWKEEYFTTITLPTNPFIIGYAGKLAKEKGVLLFLEALKNLPLELIWRGIIAGDGPLRTEVENECAKKEWNRKVKFLGQIETDENFYQTLSILVVPSFYSFESLGLTALEGIQAGIPTLVSNTGNLSTFIANKTAYPLLNPNPKSIAETITSLCNQMKPTRNISKTNEQRKDFINFFRHIMTEA